MVFETATPVFAVEELLGFGAVDTAGLLVVTTQKTEEAEDEIDNLTFLFLFSVQKKTDMKCFQTAK